MASYVRIEERELEAAGRANRRDPARVFGDSTLSITPPSLMAFQRSGCSLVSRTQSNQP
jgi:hypothetical protein